MPEFRARLFWRLDDWNAYFSPIGHDMEPAYIKQAANWLRIKNYPKPDDCPRGPRCPKFKPICLIHDQCIVARGMSEGETGTIKCVMCDHMINVNCEFRDEQSRTEFGISGMCQACQDKVFGP